MAGTVEGAAGPRRGCGRGGASPWRRGRAGLLVCALAALSLQGRPAAAQDGRSCAQWRWQEGVGEASPTITVGPGAGTLLAPAAARLECWIV